MKRFKEPLSMIPCSECRIGQMRRTHVTYFTWAGSEMITVPDFPAWVCDICGKREYDLEALSRLSLVLFPPQKSQTTTPTVRRTERNLPPTSPK